MTTSTEGLGQNRVPGYSAWYHENIFTLLVFWKILTLLCQKFAFGIAVNGQTLNR